MADQKLLAQTLPEFASTLVRDLTMTGTQGAPSASALERAFRYNRPWLHLLLAGARVATRWLQARSQ